MLNLLWWALFGLVAGIIAKLIMPGKQGGGIILTSLLGIVGAVVGGWLGNLLGIGGVGTNEFSLVNTTMAVAGALLVLVIYGFISKPST